jgi:hypothetical protein
VIGIMLVLFGLSTVAAETRINLESFLKQTLDEYRRFTKEEASAELVYKINMAQDGIVVDSKYGISKNSVFSLSDFNSIYMKMILGILT